MTISTSGGCVYVFSVPSGHHKIGVAHDPERRRRRLQTGNHEPITFVGASVPFGADDRLQVCAYEFERLVHQMLAGFQRRGEWFLVPLDQIIEVWRLAYARLLRQARRKEREHGKAGE